MSLYEVAYVVVVHLRHELPELEILFFHFPARTVDTEEHTYRVEGMSFLTPHLHHAGLVRSLKRYLCRVTHQLLEAPMVAQGLFSWELLYREDSVLAPAEELPEPTICIRSGT